MFEFEEIDEMEQDALLDDPGDDDEEEEEEEEEKEKPSGGVGDLLDDIFAEEAEDDDKLKAFGDLEHLTMVEVSSEVEAVLEELKIRQGGYE